MDRDGRARRGSERGELGPKSALPKELQVGLPAIGLLRRHHVVHRTPAAGGVPHDEVRHRACGDGPAGNDNADEVVGVYLLQTINGQSLPVIVEQVGSDMVEVIEGTVTLDADGTFDDVTELRITESGVVTNETPSETWTLTGSTVRLSPTGFASYDMTWDGADRLTQVLASFTLVYER